MAYLVFLGHATDRQAEATTVHVAHGATHEAPVHITGVAIVASDGSAAARGCASGAIRHADAITAGRSGEGWCVGAVAVYGTMAQPHFGAVLECMDWFVRISNVGRAKRKVYGAFSAKNVSSTLVKGT